MTHLRRAPGRSLVDYYTKEPVRLKHESRSFSKPLWESTDWNDLDMPWPVTSVSDRSALKKRFIWNYPGIPGV
jgi:hypothetical protein